jgi:preprotein translocase SecE subunit
VSCVESQEDLKVARITTRPEEDEEDMDVAEDESSEENGGVSAPVMPAVSDRRRRRLMKRGELPAASDVDAAEESEVQTTSKNRPTPSQRTETVKSSNIVVRFVQNIVEYLREVKTELGKVTWLSREENLRLTYIVLVVTIISSLFLGFIGLLFGALTQAMAASTGGIAAGAVAIVIILGVGGAWLLRDRIFPTHFE